MDKTKNYLLLLIGVLAAKALLIGWFILHGGIGLGPDEAQYWTWSRLPDWGYYSKPPGIAWQIWLGTHLFGHTELGVRALPVLIGFLLPLAIFTLGKRCNLTPAACFWAAICFAFSPMGLMASLLAITDGGMILCWTLACAHMAGSIEREKTPNYFLLAIIVLIGALFKWTMFGFWLVVLVCAFFYGWRHWGKLLAGAALSLAALLPSVYWNVTHEWATFRHVLATLSGGHAAPKPGTSWAGNPLEFLGSQAALLSPILFVLLCLAWWQLCRLGRAAPHGVFFCALLSLAIVTGGVVTAFFMKMQGNWIIFAYPTAFVAIAWFGSEGLAKRWLVGGVVLSTLLCAFILFLPTIQSKGFFASTPIPYRVNPYRHNVGWQQLAPALADAGYDPEKDFLFGDKYQTASILSFYAQDQRRAYFLNLGGARKNQFSYWPSMADEQKGRRGFFVVVENVPQLDNAALPERYLEQLKPYFKEVRYLGIKPLFSAYGKVVKGALLFEGIDYNGLAPVDPDLY